VDYGDASIALEQEWIAVEELLELGEIIQHEHLRRRSQRDITIADLTGVAVQDIAIAELVLSRLQGSSKGTEEEKMKTTGRI
jgi:ornithine cyclodeaminase